MDRFAKKVVLNSVSGYARQHERLIEKLLEGGVQLLCVVGKDCELWHDIMDEIIVGDGSDDRFYGVLTTWHDNESVDEVIEFARLCYVDGIENADIQVIDV